MARALLAKPPMLLLDEPSSMFDPATEQRLIARLRTLQDTTIVLVTHRMAMLALVDRLIVFDKGRIVADGPRDEVMRVIEQPGGQACGGTGSGGMSALNARPLPLAHPDPEREPRSIVIRMLALIAVLVVLTLAWATFAQLDVSVNGRGAITPPSHLQEVQSLEGGIVREMLVKPGQRVRRGDLLLRLDTAQYDANLGASVQNRLAALAGRARLDALLSGGTPRFAPEWQQEAPELIAKETQLWRDGQREFASATAAAREGVTRRRGELAEAHSRIAQLETGLKNRPGKPVDRRAVVQRGRRFARRLPERAAARAAAAHGTRQPAQLRAAPGRPPWPRRRRRPAKWKRACAASGARSAANMKPRPAPWPAPSRASKTR